MSLFTIGDLHLSFDTEKPMSVFCGWDDYIHRLEIKWRSKVNDNDTIVLPGDFSWGMSLKQSKSDFAFLESLPGRKILLRGNHDYWWNSLAKNISFIQNNGFSSIEFLQNNFFDYKGTALCGTRGWFFDESDKASEKISAREAIRLKLSIDAAISAGFYDVMVFLHFPPIYKDKTCDDLITIMKEYGVKKCFYGHLHGKSIIGSFNGQLDGIEYRLVSADYLQFEPFEVII